MTTAEALKRECEEVMKQKEVFVPPYRMVDITRAAHEALKAIQKVMGLLSYHELVLVLKILLNAVEQATKKEG